VPAGKEQPIGIFDSGIGGLTVANAIINHLPNEQVIYFGDTAHMPYGDKSPEAIRHYSEKISEFLLSKNCKLILIACNTASAAAFDYIQSTIGKIVPVENVIDPVVNEVVKDNDLGKVGVIGTKNTISSGVYEKKLKALKPSLEVVSLATGLLASMIEEGYYNNSVSQAIINSYLTYPDFQDIDGIVLGCTHYPLIKKEIKYFYHERIKIFDSTLTVARRIEEVLKEKNLLNDGVKEQHQFYVSDLTNAFQQTTKIFFGEKINLEHYPLWEALEK